MRGWPTLVVAMAVGCVRDGTYLCDRDESCSMRAGGRCEAERVCSYPDADCPSQRRYSRFAGSLANGCVPEAMTTGTTGGSSSSSTTGDSGETGLATGTTTDATTGSPNPLCEGIDCSGNGTCVVVDDEATCACELGTYRIGLTCLADPCEPCGDRCTDRACVYFDDAAPCDGAAGTRSDPLCTVEQLRAELTAAAEATLPTYILLARGGSWTISDGPSFVIDAPQASVDAPLVLGAWGDQGEYPRLTGGTLAIRGGANFEVRGLELDGDSGNDTFPCMSVSDDARQITIADVFAHDCNGHGIDIGNANRVTIIDSVIDTVVEAGMWSGIALGDPAVESEKAYFVVDSRIDRTNDAGIRVRVADDVKLLGNMIAETNCAGIIVRGGTAWIVGNVVATPGPDMMCNEVEKVGILITGSTKNTQISGNIVFDAERPMRVEMPSRLAHNTIFDNISRDPNDPAAIRFTATAVVASTELRQTLIPTADGILIDVPDQEPMLTIDDNVYAPIGDECRFRANAMEITSFLEWVTQTNADTMSRCTEVSVSGLGEPPPGWNSTDDWNEAFFENLHPDNGFDLCDPAPGALACDGSPQGREIRPLPGDVAGEGVRWTGPLEVRQRYVFEP